MAAAAFLTLVEAAITTRLNGGAVESYTERGRNLRYISITDLFTLRDQLRREVESEKAGGLPVMYGVKDRRLAEST